MIIGMLIGATIVTLIAYTVGYAVGRSVERRDIDRDEHLLDAQRVAKDMELQESLQSMRRENDRLEALVERQERLGPFR